MIVSSSKAHEAATLLNLDLVGLTEERVNEHFRRYSKDCHPDHHGNAELERWSQITWAKAVLLGWLEKNPAQTIGVEEPECFQCKGSGRIKVGRNFKQFTMQCPRCKGSGTLSKEENDSDCS